MSFNKIILFLIRLFSGLFLLVYIVLLTLSYNLKGYVKQATKEFAINHVDEQIDRQLERLTDQDMPSPVTGFMDQVIPGLSPDGKLLKMKFREAADKLFSKNVIDQQAMNEFYKEHRHDYIEFDATQALKEKHYVLNWIKIRYISTKKGLLREIRANLAGNAIVLLALFLTSLFAGRINLGLPLGILVLVSVVGTYPYIGHQDWMFKLLKQEFSGFTYLIFYLVLLIWTLFLGWTNHRSRSLLPTQTA